MMGQEHARWMTHVEVKLRDQPRECVAIVYLDDAHEVLDLRLAEDQRSGEVRLPLRDILRDVLQHEPAAIGLAHNHPSGQALPSASDKQATQTLCAMLRPLGVQLADHVILAGKERVSFRALGLL